MKNFVLILLAILFFTACNDDDNDEEYVFEESFSPITQVTHPDTVISGQAMMVDIVHTGFYGCHVYANHYVLQADTVYTIEMYVKRTQEYCTTQVIHIETTITISFDSPGAHILKFKQREGYIIDTVWVTNSL